MKKLVVGLLCVSFLFIACQSKAAYLSVTDKMGAEIQQLQIFTSTSSAKHFYNNVGSNMRQRFSSLFYILDSAVDGLTLHTLIHDKGLNNRQIRTFSLDFLFAQKSSHALSVLYSDDNGELSQNKSNSRVFNGRWRHLKSWTDGAIISGLSAGSSFSMNLLNPDDKTKVAFLSADGSMFDLGNTTSSFASDLSFSIQEKQQVNDVPVPSLLLLFLAVLSSLVLRATKLQKTTI